MLIANFFVTAVSADAIFVFTENWKETAKTHKEVFKNDRGSRMAFTIRTTSRKLVFTSFTIVVGLLANTMCPLMPIRAFSITCAVCCLTNFALIVMVMPSALAIHEEYMIGGRKLSTCLKGPAKQEPQVENDIEEKKEEEGEPVKELGRLDSFCDGRMNNWVHYCRKPCAALYFIWFMLGLLPRFLNSLTLRCIKILWIRQFW